MKIKKIAGMGLATLFLLNFAANTVSFAVPRNLKKIVNENNEKVVISKEALLKNSEALKMQVTPEVDSSEILKEDLVKSKKISKEQMIKKDLSRSKKVDEIFEKTIENIFKDDETILWMHSEAKKIERAIDTEILDYDDLPAEMRGAHTMPRRPFGCFTELYYGNSSMFENEIGWKLHVSPSPSKCAEVLKIVDAFCKTNKIDYKFVSTVPKYRHLCQSGTHGGSQQGKFITIYPKSDEMANFAAESLARSFEQLKMKPSDFETILFDVCLYPGIYARPACFRGSKCLEDTRNNLVNPDVLMAIAQGYTNSELSKRNERDFKEYGIPFESNNMFVVKNGQKIRIEPKMNANDMCIRINGKDLKESLPPHSAFRK